MQDNLPELRDIHLPTDTISLFPLAYGWWVILAVIIAAVALFFAVRCLLKKSKKRYALKLLSEIEGEGLTAAVKMSEILRRICVYKYKNAAVLFGKDWIDFLNLHAKHKLEGRAANLLKDAPYIGNRSSVYNQDDLKELYSFCQSWIGDNL